MGYASCLENNIERADDRAFMAQSFRFQAVPAPMKPPRITLDLAAPKLASPTPISQPRVSVGDRWRDMRDIHVLCLSELRPKSQLGLRTV
jgi:hypothetical protein